MRSRRPQRISVRRSREHAPTPRRRRSARRKANATAHAWRWSILVCWQAEASLEPARAVESCPQQRGRAALARTARAGASRAGAEALGGCLLSTTLGRRACSAALWREGCRLKGSAPGGDRCSGTPAASIAACAGRRSRRCARCSCAWPSPAPSARRAAARAAAERQVQAGGRCTAPRRAGKLLLALQPEFSALRALGSGRS
jgi:hypothetical protein